MAKRFSDTQKYKKQFIRSLPGPYKILWDYLCCECDHAGIWYVDFEVAQICIGKDSPVDIDTALKLFNQDEERIIVISNGKKWFIKPFIEFQYGVLNPTVKVHASVLAILLKEGVEGVSEPFTNSSQRVKDKDKDTAKDKVKEGGLGGDSAPPVDNPPEPLPPATGKVKTIAHEKSGIAWVETRAAIEKHVRDGTKLVVTDALAREVFFALGGMDAFRTPLESGNGTLAALEQTFRSRYERREMAEFARNRSG